MKARMLVAALAALSVVSVICWPDAAAYERYNDGCQTCHGAFTDDTSTKGSVFPRPLARLRLVYAVPEGKHGCIPRGRQEKKHDSTYEIATFFEGGFRQFPWCDASCIAGQIPVHTLPSRGDSTVRAAIFIGARRQIGRAPWVKRSIPPCGHPHRTTREARFCWWGGLRDA